MPVTPGQNEHQDKVFDWLINAAKRDGVTARRIDTHAASVFLVGNRVYKIKRAVKFPFLDYSTTAKRKAACDAELKVNQRFAPNIYRGVIAITHEPDGTFAFNGSGETVEWAVEMLRFDESATLDHLADQDKIDPELADALGRAVAAAHRLAPTVEAKPWIDALAQYIAQNDKAFGAMPKLLPGADVAALTDKSSAALDRLRPMLHARGAEGLVRRGHGDMHLGNIVLIDNRPVLFDAIEFDELIASGDVLYDLAFLLMDLVERGLPHPANIVFNRYLADARRNTDLDALAALPLFMSMRAAIRAKVTAARLETLESKDHAAITKSALAYFRLACELMAPPAPRLLAVGGLSGTGKSALARRLAADVPPSPGAVLLRSDVERKAMFGCAETERLPADAYSADATGRVYASLAEKAKRIVAAGHSAIVDAVFAKEAERAAIMAVAEKTGVAFHPLFLHADVATRMARVGGRRGDASDADASIVRQQEGYDLGAMDWPKIDASGTPEATLAHARAAIAR